MNEKQKANFSLPKRMWDKTDLSEAEIKAFKNNFNQISGEDFIRIQNERFTPYIKSLGFKGSKNNFYKRNSPWIYTLNIFKDKYGGECALNIGIHLEYIENQLGELPIPGKFTISDCIIDKNIAMDNGNSWFYYGINETEGYETIDIMIEMFEKKGIPFLNKLKNYPIPFSLIKPGDIETPSDKFIEYEISIKLLGWVHFLIFLAKFNFNIGRKEFAIKILEKAKTNEIIRMPKSPLIEKLNELIKIGI
jgi:hypothetical protein